MRSWSLQHHLPSPPPPNPPTPSCRNQSRPTIPRQPLLNPSIAVPRDLRRHHVARTSNPAAAALDRMCSAPVGSMVSSIASLRAPSVYSLPVSLQKQKSGGRIRLKSSALRQQLSFSGFIMFLLKRSPPLAFPPKSSKGGIVTLTSQVNVAVSLLTHGSSSGL
jgi:hypothetical protein